jgi:hypothetical protein
MQAQPLLINGHQRPLATATATPSAPALRQASAPSLSDSFGLDQPLPSSISDPVWPPGEDRPGSEYLEIDAYEGMAVGRNQVLFCLLFLSFSFLVSLVFSCFFLVLVLFYPVVSSANVSYRDISCLILSCLALPCLVCRVVFLFLLLFMLLLLFLFLFLSCLVLS